jgi:hypothetical protein
VRSAGAPAKHTTDDTPTCQCATNATRRTTRLSNTAHTLPRPSEDETEQWRCPACSDPTNTTPPDAPLVRAFWADAWETEENLRGPRYGSSNQEWNTVYKDQAPPVSADALDKDLTNSERQGCGRMQGKWISTRQAGSLETHC